MRRIITALMAMSITILAAAQAPHAQLAKGLYVGGEKSHVQGIAVDEKAGIMYMSFTTVFYKMDLEGKVLASMVNIPGHLGAMTYNPQDGKVYASLEFKDDEIGRGIANTLNVDMVQQSVFYVAIIDVAKMDKVGVSAEDNELFKAVCIKDACRDYADKVTNGGKEVEHRYGCSGIDGVTFAPAFGSRSDKLYLYVGYGIYGDNSRTDNDYQVLCCYDTRNWDAKYAQTLSYGNTHMSGPEKPKAKYFLRTVNTTWGIQNMGYDTFTDKIFMMVYKGRKPGCPNYDIYSVDMAQKPFKAALEGNDDTMHKEGKVKQIKLSPAGLYDKATDTWGWRFKWGSTGFCPLGDGWYLFSENGRDKNDPKVNNFTTINLYRWTGEDIPFRKAND